jgi:hypothetical protein
MTRVQVESALSNSGNSTGEWVSLEGDFKYIVLESDKNSFINPISIQYYFSPTGDYFLTRHLYGPAREVLVSDPTPSGYSRVFHDGKYYVIAIEPGGVVDASVDDAGVYHTLSSFSVITGMFYSKQY